MRHAFKASAILSAALLAGCVSHGPAAPDVVPAPEARSEPTAPTSELAPAPAAAEPTETPSQGDASQKGSLESYLAELSSISCPAGEKRRSAEAVELNAKAAPLQALNPSRRQVGELTFVAGFHLTSPDKRFGGLSGIDLLDDANLLAVSDQGDFVWIDLAEDGLTPKAARISAMRNAMGEVLRGKAEGDAEGLAVNGGMALVSYERDHRVLAYDIGRCGASARGAPIVFGGYGEPLAKAFSEAGLTVGDNQGPEPLAVTPDWHLFAGVETKAGDASPMSARPIEAAADFSLRVGKGVPEFVGLDVIPSGRDRQDVRAFSLHRGFSALAGSAITIMETDFRRTLDQSRLPRRIVSETDERSHYRFDPWATKILAQMNILFNIDNFEGLAAKELPDGRVRLYLISDDNFSAGQRTLLFVFETSK